MHGRVDKARNRESQEDVSTSDPADEPLTPLFETSLGSLLLQLWFVEAPEKVEEVIAQT